jgi:hypothetical protein
MTNEDWFRNPELTAKPGNIVCKGWYIVPVLRPVTAATPTQIQRHHRMGRLKVVILRLEESVVAAPAVYKYQRWITTSFLLVI